MKDPVYEYFAGKVEDMSVPAFPEDLSLSLKSSRRKDRFQWRDTLAVAACLVFVLMILARPASFDTPVRNISISPERIEEVKGNVNKVFLEAGSQLYSVYY